MLPRGVAICGDRILITQENHCILNYQLNGKFVSRIGREGKRELNLTAPFGLTIDESMKIFIFVIITTIVFRYCQKNSLSNLSLVKILSNTLVM